MRALNCFVSGPRYWLKRRPKTQTRTIKVMNHTRFGCLTGTTFFALSTALASAVVFESFETHPLFRSQSGGPPENPPYTNAAQSTVAVTDGTYSFTASFTNDTWSWMYKAVVSGSVTNSYYGPATYFEWYRHKQLKVDLHRPALPWGWNLEFVLAMNGTALGGWRQEQLLNWVWLNADAASSETLTWDYSAIRDAASPNGSSWQLGVMARGNAPGGGTIYIDNLRFEDLVPALGFTFPKDIQNWVPQGWGTALAGTYWDPADAANDPDSGSLLCFCDFANADTNQTAVFQVWNFSPDTRDYARLSFDLKVDAGLSTPSVNGDYGAVQVVLRGGDINWNPIGTQLIPAQAADAFMHFELPLYQPLPTNLVGLNLIFGGTNLQDNIWYYVDNIFLEVETNAPTLVLREALPGLELNASATSADQRQSIRTQTGAHGWIGRPGTVNYAMTINEGLTGAAAGMMAYLFLIPTENSSPTARADYEEANGLYLEITQQADALATAVLRYKTNAPNAHGIRYTSEGILVTLPDVTLQGDWNLAVNILGNAAQAELTAPEGAAVSFTLPPDLVAAFSGTPSPAYVYWGIQPNAEANLGQWISLARVQISGLEAPVDQLFTSQSALDENVLVVSADHPGGVRLRPPNTVYRLSWDALVSGFNLYSAPTVGGPWQATGLPVMEARWNNIIFVPATALPATGQGYFRLQKP